MHYGLCATRGARMKPQFINMPFEVKSVEFKETDKKFGIIEGYAASTGNIDFGQDRISRGAFAKTIKEKGGKWPVLADHDPRKQIGFNIQAKEDDHGLKIKEEINLDVRLGQERFSLAKQALNHNIPFGLSIGYSAVKFDFEEDEQTGMRIRNLKEVKMYEHSHVTFPMNEDAFVTAAKGWASQNFEGSILAFFDQMKSAGHAEEDIFQYIERLKIKNSLKSLEPDNLVHSMDQLINLMKN